MVACLLDLAYATAAVRLGRWKKNACLERILADVQEKGVVSRGEVKTWNSKI